MNIEDLLKRVQQAETETDRQWILLELQMSQMSDALVSMLWAAAIPHFFDAKVLAALRPELADSAEELYAELHDLTFVEEFVGHGDNIHELTRDVLLRKLWEQNQTEFRDLSRRAADYFFSAGISPEEDVEFCYHEIINEEEAQTGRLLNRVIDWWTYNQIHLIFAALQGFSEHEESGRIHEFGLGFSEHLRGIINLRSANYREADSFLARAQTTYQRIELKNPQYITTLLRDLGNSQKKQGNNKNALLFAEKSLNICEEQLGEHHPDTATGLDNLASLYQATGRYSEAEPLFLRAQKIREEQLGEHHPNTANSLNNLAMLYKVTGRYSEAEPLFLRAQKIYEEQLGEHHPDTANSLNNLASLYQDTGRYSEAEPLFLRAQKIREEQLGEHHPDTATGLNNLAMLYQATGRYSEAEPLFLRSQKIYEEQLGEHHPNTATGLNNLALLYQDTGRYSEAEPLFLRAQKIWEEQLSGHHPNTATSLNNLASLYQATGRYSEAISLFLRAQKICEEQLGEHHPNTATSLNNLASLYQATGRYSEAISLLERWKRIKHERQETQNQSFAERICTLGKLYERCQRFSEAVATYEDALLIFNRLLGSQHLRTRVLKGELGRLKKRMKRKRKLKRRQSHQ